MYSDKSRRDSYSWYMQNALHGYALSVYKSQHRRRDTKQGGMSSAQ